MRRLLLGIVLCAPLLLFSQQDPNLNTDTTFPGDKPAAKSGSLPDAPIPAKKPASSFPDAPTPSAKPSTDSKPAEPPADDASAPPPSAPLPRSEGESSSKDNKTDISPPPGDEDHPGVDLPSDVEEMHPWNPHQADKNVEIGDFYYKKSNYHAAESRYQEALRYQWNHAEATYKLALVEEKLDEKEDARKNYSVYLKILPNGPDAEKAQKALDRLGGPVPVTAQNKNPDATGDSQQQDQNAHHKTRLRDLKPGCIHLGNSPCYGTPSTKDPGTATNKSPQDPGSTSPPAQNPQ